MSHFDITRAYNASFDPEIDAQLMGLAEFITGEHLKLSSAPAAARFVPSLLPC